MSTVQVGQDEGLNLKQITCGNLTWINIYRPTDKEIQYLSNRFHFNRFDLDDCLSRIQRPKIDEYEDYLFIVVHFPLFNKQTRVSYRGQFSAFVLDNCLITLHSGNLKALVQLYTDCEESEQARQANFSHGAGFLLYRIVDKGVDSYFPVLDKILSMLDDIEDSVFDEDVETGRGLATLRRDIIMQRRIFWPMRSMLTVLETKLQKYIKMDISVHWGDLMDHVNMICESIDESREIIEVYKDTDYLLSNYRLNRTTRVLAALSAVFLPFLIISSMYGMNVILPGGLEPGSLLSFGILLGLMVVAMLVMLFIFRRKRVI